MPLVTHMGLTKLAEGLPGLPATVYQGYKGAMLVRVVMNGKDEKYGGVNCVGTVPAALTTYAAVQSFQPDLILNAGTAGGFAAKGGKICDVYVASGVAFHDRRIFIPGTQVQLQSAYAWRR